MKHNNLWWVGTTTSPRRSSRNYLHEGYSSNTNWNSYETYEASEDACSTVQSMRCTGPPDPNNSRHSKCSWELGSGVGYGTDCAVTSTVFDKSTNTLTAMNCNDEQIATCKGECDDIQKCATFSLKNPGSLQEFEQCCTQAYSCTGPGTYSILYPTTCNPEVDNISTCQDMQHNKLTYSCSHSASKSQGNLSKCSKYFQPVGGTDGESQPSLMYPCEKSGGKCEVDKSTNCMNTGR